MTRTAQVLLIALMIGVGMFGEWVTGVAAVPSESPLPVVEDPSAAPRPASDDRVLTPPAIADLVAPLALAAICGTALALFSPVLGRAGRHSARARFARRRAR
jgi:hypothetical protein